MPHLNFSLYLCDCSCQCTKIQIWPRRQQFNSSFHAYTKWDCTGSHLVKINYFVIGQYWIRPEIRKKQFIQAKIVPRVMSDWRLQNTVVSEKNGTFICELIMKRYVYLRKSQKQLKTTSYGRNKIFFEFYLVYNGFCLKFLRSLL